MVLACLPRAAPRKRPAAAPTEEPQASIPSSTPVHAAVEQSASQSVAVAKAAAAEQPVSQSVAVAKAVAAGHGVSQSVAVAKAAAAEQPGPCTHQNKMHQAHKHGFEWGEYVRVCGAVYFDYIRYNVCTANNDEDRDPAIGISFLRHRCGLTPGRCRSLASGGTSGSRLEASPKARDLQRPGVKPQRRHRKLVPAAGSWSSSVLALKAS
jgi:hypothetical protein